MNSQRTIDPQDVLDEHSRQATRAYRARLREAFEDPKAAAEAFHAEAVRIGPTDAAIHMRGDPASFGTLHAPGPGAPSPAEIARDAAGLGVRAYEARIALTDPALGARVLERTFNEAVSQIGVDSTHVGATWDALATAYGSDAAASIFRESAREIVGSGIDPAAAEHLAALAHARDALRERAGITEARRPNSVPPLPRAALDEPAPARARPAEIMHERLRAATDGFRKRLAAAYENPVATEAVLHMRISETGMDAIAAAKHDPASIGTLVPRAADSLVSPVSAAEDALDWAAVAYAYGGARTQDAAAELHARTAIEAINRSAANVERAIAALDEAIRLHGPALESRLYATRAPDLPGPGRSGPDGSSGPGAPGQSQDAATPPLNVDTGVDNAVRANERLAKVQDLSERIRALRAERSAAQAILSKLDGQDHDVLRTRRDLGVVAGRMYRDPDSAIDNWSKLVEEERGNIERARKRVENDPSLLGRLKTERETGWKGRLGMTTDGEARGEAAAFGKRAEAYSRADVLARAPLQWTSPSGEVLHDRGSVRAAANEIVTGRVRDIESMDATLKDMGGVKGNQVAAENAMKGLSAPQSSKVAAALTKTNGANVAQAALGLLQKAAMVARTTRTLGEGPAM